MQYDFNQQTLLLNHIPLSLIKAQGIDAKQFLNSQFTNDLDKLDDTDWQLNGYCNSKGRLLSIMRVYQQGDAVYLIAPTDIIEILYKHLQIFIFRSKVKLSIIKQISIQSIIGPATQNYIQSQFGVTLAKNSCLHINNSLLLDLSSSFDQCLIISDLSFNFKELETLFNIDSKMCWHLSQIRQGNPNIYNSSQGKFIPQQLNLESKNGLSFTKGCYPGQEVIARLHYLGKSKQSMQAIQFDSDKPIKAGDLITIEKTNTKASIVDAVEIVKNKYECLAVAKWPIILN